MLIPLEPMFLPPYVKGDTQQHFLVTLKNQTPIGIAVNLSVSIISLGKMPSKGQTVLVQVETETQGGSYAADESEPAAAVPLWK